MLLGVQHKQLWGLAHHRSTVVMHSKQGSRYEVRVNGSGIDRFGLFCETDFGMCYGRRLVWSARLGRVLRTWSRYQNVYVLYNYRDLQMQGHLSNQGAFRAYCIDLTTTPT